MSRITISGPARTSLDAKPLGRPYSWAFTTSRLLPRVTTKDTAVWTIFRRSVRFCSRTRCNAIQRDVREHRSNGVAAPETDAQEHLLDAALTSEKLGLTAQFDRGYGVGAKENFNGSPRRDVVIRRKRLEDRFLRGKSNRETARHRVTVALAFGHFTLGVDPAEVAIAEARERDLDFVEWLNVKPRHHCHDGDHMSVSVDAQIELLME